MVAHFSCPVTHYEEAESGKIAYLMRISCYFCRASADNALLLYDDALPASHDDPVKPDDRLASMDYLLAGMRNYASYESKVLVSYDDDPSTSDDDSIASGNGSSDPAGVLASSSHLVLSLYWIAFS